MVAAAGVCFLINLRAPFNEEKFQIESITNALFFINRIKVFLIGQIMNHRKDSMYLGARESRSDLNET